MKFHKYVLVFCFAGMPFIYTNAQTRANEILHAVFAKLEKTKDYSVQANIKVDMPFIRILPVKVKIYFKQKDKFKVESKSIAIVPRQGFSQIQNIIADTNSFTSMIQGEEKYNSIQTIIINVIPLSDTGEMILGKFWIDPKQNLIIKSQITTRSNGTIETEYLYGSQAEYGLPDEMIFSVDVKKFKISLKEYRWILIKTVQQKTKKIKKVKREKSLFY